MKLHVVMPMIIAAAASIAATPGLAATGAVAGSSAQIEKDHLTRGTAHPATQHRRHVARREFIPGSGAYNAADPSLYRGPGYIYVPRRGILDEACNLPTSTCPNEMRDVQ
jgi:hypothetical protein